MNQQSTQKPQHKWLKVLVDLEATANSYAMTVTGGEDRKKEFYNMTPEQQLRLAIFQSYHMNKLRPDQPPHFFKIETNDQD
jgi:hypothetical protein